MHTTAIAYVNLKFNAAAAQRAGMPDPCNAGFGSIVRQNCPIEETYRLTASFMGPSCSIMMVPGSFDPNE